MFKSYYMHTKIRVFLYVIIVYVVYTDGDANNVYKFKKCILHNIFTYYIFQRFTFNHCTIVSRARRDIDFEQFQNPLQATCILASVHAIGE